VILGKKERINGEDFKAALVKAEKDGSISKEELDFRIMKMMDEKDRLKRAKNMIGIKKQKAELTGQSLMKLQF
jgi:hypothetical protein